MTGHDPDKPRPREDEQTSSSGHFTIQFNIEGHDENSEPGEGHLLGEVPPEPPPQAYETLGDGGLTFELDADPEERKAITAKRREEEDKDDVPAGAKKPPPATGGAPAQKPTAKSYRPKRPPLWLRLVWHAMPILLFVAGYATVVGTQTGGVGYAWDEAYFYEPSLDAAEWLGRTLHGERPFGKTAITKYWGKIPEHPSMLKLLSGAGLMIFSQPGQELWAMRWPMAILFGLTLSLVYLLGRRVWGPAPSLIAALIYLTLPRVFGHAHFASYETPLVFMTVLVVFCFLRGLDSVFWSAMTGLAFGLLLATKINAFFVPIALLLWAHLFARKRYVNNLFCMIFAGPIAMLAVWPWLWHETIMRFLQYLAFHATHQKTALWFLGQKWGYGDVNAPWFYPLLIIAVSTPLPSLLLMLWGLLHTLAKPARRPVSMLFVTMAAVMLAVACAPGTPKYDGVRLFLPAFPFLALLGGAGAWSLLNLLARPLEAMKLADPARHQKLLRRMEMALGLIILAAGLTAIARYHPRELSYFNVFAGGLGGAYQSRDFETTYWGEAIDSDVIAELNRLPKGSSVKPLACHALCLEHLQRWGALDPSLRIDGEPPFDAHLALYRRGFFGQAERMLFDERRWGNLSLDDTRARIWTKMGVPMAGLFWTSTAPSPLTPPAARETQ